jgi:hypothetical protein
MSRHDVPLDPLTRHAFYLTQKGYKVLQRVKRLTYHWEQRDWAFFGNFVKDRDDRFEFKEWVKLRHRGRAANNPQYELLLAEFEQMRRTTQKRRTK